jgi:SOS response regulatory protein OraA/RecX
MQVCRTSSTKRPSHVRSICFPPNRAASPNCANDCSKKRGRTKQRLRGYLNDEKFAEQYANSRLSTKPLGRARLRRDLQRKKISSTVINQALEDVYTTHDEDALIDQAIAKRTRLRGKPTTREEAKKLLDHLMRLGFSYDLVSRKVRETNWSDDSEEDAP